jgi:hypothetical protein
MDWIRQKVPIRPDPDPSDPYVLGPPGSGSIIQMYGSGSGSFYHQVKILRKTLTYRTVLLLHVEFLSLKIYVNVPYLQKVISRKFFFK